MLCAHKNCFPRLQQQKIIVRNINSNIGKPWGINEPIWEGGGAEQTGTTPSHLIAVLHLAGTPHSFGTTVLWNSG